MGFFFFFVVILRDLNNSLHKVSHIKKKKKKKTSIVLYLFKFLWISMLKHLILSMTTKVKDYIQKIDHIFKVNLL